MPKRLANDGTSWSARDVQVPKKLAKTGTATAAAKTLGRTPEATQQKAMRLEIPFSGRRYRTARKK